MRRPQITVGLVAVVLCVVGGCAQGPYEPSSSTAYLKDDVYYCEVHDRPLRMGLVRIEYGYMRSSKAFRELSITTFPNSKRYYSGGCSHDSESPHYRWVWYCPACRYAEECWEKQPDSVKQAIERTLDGGLETPPDDADAWAAVALRQTDDDLIDICLQHLRFSLMESKDRDAFRRTLAAYARVAKKLEAGWPGFSGEIVSISGKQHRRRTEGDLLEHEYGLWSVMWFIFVHSFNSQVCSEVYTAFAPTPDHGDLRDAWLLRAMGEPSHDHVALFSPAAGSQASEPKTDTHGNGYQQLSGLMRQVPVRQILVTRPDGSQFSFATFLIDDRIATAAEMIEVCEKEQAREAADPKRFVLRPYWRP